MTSFKGQRQKPIAGHDTKSKSGFTGVKQKPLARPSGAPKGSSGGKKKSGKRGHGGY